MKNAAAVRRSIRSVSGSGRTAALCTAAAAKTIGLAAILAVCSLHAAPRIVGYYPAWVRSVYPAERIELEHLTHVCHAFVRPEPDGGLSMDSSFKYPQLVERVHGAGAKILVSLGGWGGSDGFPQMAATAVYRSRFIENITDFCLNQGYDGVDIDWEHPASDSEKNSLNVLVRELRAAFDRRDSTLLITMAVPAGSWSGKWFDYTALESDVDWFGCMTYDFHGNWSDHAGHNSPLYSPQNDPCGSVHDGIRYLSRSRGISKAKILAGLPFYGREFNAARLYGPSTGSENEYHYSDIVNKIGKGWRRHWDGVSFVPYLQNDAETKLISYDDTLSIRLKCEYAKNENLAGVMIWALGQDAIGTTQPLLESAGAAMAGYTLAPPLPENLLKKSFQLHSYPNPFNLSTRIDFTLPAESFVTLTLHDILGRTVAYVLSQSFTAGEHAVRCSGAGLDSGLYFFKLTAGNRSIVRKCLIVK